MEKLKLQKRNVLLLGRSFLIIYSSLIRVFEFATKPRIGESKCRRGWCVWWILAKETFVFPALVTKSVKNGINSVSKMHGLGENTKRDPVWHEKHHQGRRKEKISVNLFEIGRMCPSVVKR